MLDQTKRPGYRCELQYFQGGSLEITLTVPLNHDLRKILWFPENILFLDFIVEGIVGAIMLASIQSLSWTIHNGTL